MQINREKLSKYTSLKVGGECDIFTPANFNELQYFLKHNHKKVLFLGLGSNILMNDSGFNGVVIRTKNLNKIEVVDGKIYAECGTTLAKLSKFAILNNQAGANFLATIPGSVGGALQMNAGCFGKEIWPSVKSIVVIDKKGNISEKTSNDFVINYRGVKSSSEEYFISAIFHFDNNALSDDILQKRYDSQPIGTKNCGSVFKNPKGDFAARLIEECGLKGFKIGGAEVSKKHANFIINTENASSKDIKNLIKHIQKAVKNKFEIDLETEVVID